METIPPALTEYVHKARAAGLDDVALTENLNKAGWKPEQITAILAKTPTTAPKETKKPKRSKGLKAIIIVAVLLTLLLGVFGYFYFFIVSPLSGNVLDLDIQKVESEINALRAGTLLPADFVVRAEHLTYVLWKIDGHKIHPDPFNSEAAQVEIVMDTSIYTTENQGDGLRSSESQSINPDVRFTLGKNELISLLVADERSQTVNNLVNTGLITVEVLKGEEVLALKGYKGIYDAISG